MAARLGGIAYNEVWKIRMPRFKSKGRLERSALADLWKHTLAGIPTAYGRLSYMGSLGDANSGLYRHHGLLTAFGREESGNALRECHEQVFAAWQALPIAQKSANLKQYLLTLEDPGSLVLRDRTRAGVDPRQLPASARAADRDLFHLELSTLLELLKNEYGAGPKSQD